MVYSVTTQAVTCETISRMICMLHLVSIDTLLTTPPASPVTVDPRLTVEDLPPISEEPPSLFTELASPECDRNLSPEVSVAFCLLYTVETKYFSHSFSITMYVCVQCMYCMTGFLLPTQLGL